MIYNIAGLRISIHNRCKYTELFCEKYLSDDQASPFDLEVAVTNEEFYEEKKCSGEYSDGYIENICLYRSLCLQMPQYSRMLLHASILQYKDAGYAFLGRSGTGKSTHTRLWIENLPNTRVVNGDKPILEEREKEFIAYGTPWQGKEGWGCNASVPLRGLCFLEQAKTNAIRRLTPAETAARLFTQILIPDDEQNAAATLELADRLISKTPAYLLSCDISEEAVKTSFEEMTGEQYEKNKK